jgi:hypothetical protein
MPACHRRAELSIRAAASPSRSTPSACERNRHRFRQRSGAHLHGRHGVHGPVPPSAAWERAAAEWRAGATGAGAGRCRRFLQEGGRPRRYGWRGCLGFRWFWRNGRESHGRHWRRHRNGGTGALSTGGTATGGGAGASTAGSGEHRGSERRARERLRLSNDEPASNGRPYGSRALFGASSTGV